MILNAARALDAETAAETAAAAETIGSEPVEGDAEQRAPASPFPEVGAADATPPSTGVGAADATPPGSVSTASEGEANLQGTTSAEEETGSNLYKGVGADSTIEGASVTPAVAAMGTVVMEDLYEEYEPLRVAPKPAQFADSGSSAVVPDSVTKREARRTVSSPSGPPPKGVYGGKATAWRVSWFAACVLWATSPIYYATKTSPLSPLPCPPTHTHTHTN